MSKPTINLVCRKFAIRNSTLDEEAQTVDAVISTDDAVYVYHPGRGVIREVITRGAFDPLPNQIPLFEEHAAGVSFQLGSARNLRVEGSELVATIHYDPDHSDRAARAWSLARKGHAVHYSIGYMPREMSLVRKGEEEEIDGQKYRADDHDTWLTTRAELREVSLTGIPANKNAAARSEKGGTQMPENTTAPEAQTQAPPVATEPQRSAPVVDIEKLRAESAKVERERIASIRSLAGPNMPEEIVARAIDGGMTKEQSAAIFLEHERTSRAAPNVNTGRGQEGIKIEELLAAGHMMRVGLGEEIIPRKASEAVRKHKEMVANEAGRFSDLSMLDQCREVCRHLYGNAMPTNRTDIIQRASSTMELAHIWTSSVNARVMQGYVAADDTTAGWTIETDVSDFKTNDRIGAGINRPLSRLPRGNSAEHTTMDDEQESYKIHRYASQLQVDDQDIIDDRLDIFQLAPFEMGQQARQVRPDLVYSILLANGNMGDGTALFHGDHGNLGSLALSEANLKTVIGKLEKQKRGNLNLNLRATFLIVNSDLKHKALELVNSSTIVVAGDTDTVRGSLNTLTTESLQVRSESRLVNGVTDPVTGTAYAGASTKWYLTASPSQARLIEVGYLAGTGRAPMVRSAPLPPGQGRYGIGWDIKLDIGAKALDWRGLQRGNA